MTDEQVVDSNPTIERLRAEGKALAEQELEAMILKLPPDVRDQARHEIKTGKIPILRNRQREAVKINRHEIVLPELQKAYELEDEVIEITEDEPIVHEAFPRMQDAEERRDKLQKEFGKGITFRIRRRKKE